MDSQWLNKQFELNPDKSKAGLAKALGLEPPAISKILKDMRQIKAHEYAIMRRYFGLPVDGETSLEKRKHSYVLKPLQNDNFEDANYEQGESEWVIPAGVMKQHTKAVNGAVKVFEVDENIMGPDFKRGEHVLVDLSDKTPSPPGIFVVSDGFGYLVRQCEFIPGSAPPEVRVSAKDGTFQPQILKQGEFKIIGRVIAKLQWL